MSFGRGRIWMNGSLVDWADAKIHIASHVIHYGTGVFEGARCYDTPRGAACFRPSALPIVVHFTDACSHEGPPGESNEVATFRSASQPATGTLSIGADTWIEGNVKAHKGVLVGPGARVSGSVTASCSTAMWPPRRSCWRGSTRRPSSSGRT